MEEAEQEMIVKCQRAMSSNVGDPPVLVYNQARDFEVYVGMDEAWKDLFASHGLKQYLGAKFFARVHLEGKVLVVEKVFERDLGW